MTRHQGLGGDRKGDLSRELEGEWPSEMGRDAEESS